MDQQRSLVEQVLEHVLGRGPVPPAAAAGAVGIAEGGGGQRPLVADALQHRAVQVAVALADVAPPAAGGGGQPPHPGQAQPEACHGQERGGVGPVLEAGPASVDEPVEGGPVVAAGPGMKDQLVAAGDHVDGVDLDGPEPLQGGAQGGRARRGGPGGGGQPLGGQGDPPGLVGGEGVGHLGGNPSRWLEQVVTRGLASYTPRATEERMDTSDACSRSCSSRRRSPARPAGGRRR
jgi:hypothetical protein